MTVTYLLCKDEHDVVHWYSKYALSRGNVRTACEMSPPMKRRDFLVETRRGPTCLWCVAITEG